MRTLLETMFSNFKKGGCLLPEFQQKAAEDLANDVVRKMEERIDLLKDQPETTFSGIEMEERIHWRKDQPETIFADITQEYLRKELRLFFRLSWESTVKFSESKRR